MLRSDRLQLPLNEKRLISAFSHCTVHTYSECMQWDSAHSESQQSLTVQWTVSLREYAKSAGECEKSADGMVCDCKESKMTLFVIGMRVKWNASCLERGQNEMACMGKSIYKMRQNVIGKHAEWDGMQSCRMKGFVIGQTSEGVGISLKIAWNEMSCDQKENRRRWNLF